MTWRTVIISPAELAEATTEIHRLHGTLPGFNHGPDGIHLTWTTPSSD